MRREPKSWPWSKAAELVHGRLHYGHVPDKSAIRRLLFAGVALIAVCAAGTIGYWRLGHGAWSWQDCAYMVLITITSVGYAEVLPLQDTANGRLFTMGLLVSGMGLSLYFLSSLTAFIIEGDLTEVLWRRRMTKRLNNLRDHIIVCGAGATGLNVVDELIGAERDVVVIERDPKRLERLSRDYGGEAFYGIQGDATEEGVLGEAGVERAHGLVSTLERDQDNLYVSLSARQLNRAIRIVSRAVGEHAEPKLRQAGADSVISPTHIGGRRMAQEMLRPNVVGFLDIISRDTQQNLGIEEVVVTAGSPLAGKKLSESKIRQVSNALVLAVKRGETHIYNPPPDYVLEEGVTMIVLGEYDQLAKLGDYIAGARLSRL